MAPSPSPTSVKPTSQEYFELEVSRSLHFSRSSPARLDPSTPSPPRFDPSCSSSHLDFFWISSWLPEFANLQGFEPFPILLHAIVKFRFKLPSSGWILYFRISCRLVPSPKCVDPAISKFKSN